MRIESKAPKGKFRVIAEDTFDNSGWSEGEFDEWIIGDFDSLAEAEPIAQSKAGLMLKTYIFDESGNLIKQFGKF